MKRLPTLDERDDFLTYCKGLTHLQLFNVYQKERAANRRVYAAIAASVLKERCLL